MKPTVRVDRPKAPTIRFNEGARRNAIVPVKSNPYINAPSRQTNAGASIVSAVAGVAGALAGRSSTSYRQDNDNRQDNRTWNKTDARAITTNNNQQDNRTQISDSHDLNQQNHLHGDVISLTEVNEHNQTNQSYQLAESHNTSVQVHESNQYSVTDDHSQHYNVQSYTTVDSHDVHNTTITNIDDHSTHVTDNSRHYAPHFTDVKQTVAFGIFFGDGLEKVLMMLVVLAILTVIFFSEVLVLMGALSVFIMGYLIARAKWKQKKFAREMEEREKDRQHQIRLAEAGKPITIHVGSAEVLTQILATDGRFTRIKETVKSDVQNARQAYSNAAQGVGKLAADTSKQAAKSAGRQAKKQANLFIKGFKEEVIGKGK